MKIILWIQERNQENVIYKNFNEYFKRCLFEDKEDCKDMSCVRSYKHELYYIKMNTLALSSKGEKIFIKENKIDT